MDNHAVIFKIERIEYNLGDKFEPYEFDYNNLIRITTKGDNRSFMCHIEELLDENGFFDDHYWFFYIEKMFMGLYDLDVDLKIDVWIEDSDTFVRQVNSRMDYQDYWVNYDNRLLKIAVGSLEVGDDVKIKSWLVAH